MSFQENLKTRDISTVRLRSFDQIKVDPFYSKLFVSLPVGGRNFLKTAVLEASDLSLGDFEKMTHRLFLDQPDKPKWLGKIKNLLIAINSRTKTNLQRQGAQMNALKLKAPKPCSCKRFCFLSIPKDAAFMSNGYWFQCPVCGSTAYVAKRKVQGA